MSVPSFIDLEESDQVVELRGYLKSKGAEIGEENATEGPVEDLLQVIAATEIIWKEAANEAEIESIFNSIISLLLLIPHDQNEELVSAVCHQVLKAQTVDKKSVTRMKVLNNLFQGLPAASTHRYIVYFAIIKLSKELDLIHVVNPKIDDIKSWFVQWDLDTPKRQEFWTALHESLVVGKQSELATKVMIELLGTYTTDNASQARDDAHKCIVACVGDPVTFLMDHLLALKPVKFLEGEPIHDLLTIFVSGKLSQYMQFYETHKDFINSTGLSHEDNVRKMRLLTFMQMCEGRKEIDYKTIQQEINIPEDEIEPFVIDMVRTKAVRIKIDQKNQVVIVSSTTHRTFGKSQWQLLREQLSEWQRHLDTVLGSLQSIPSH